MNAIRVLVHGATLALAAACTAGTGAPKATDAAAVEGTAAYRERIALPAGAEFEAVLQDVSRADAPAMEIGRATIANAPNPPIRFTIPFQAGRIDAAHAYAVRAVIRVDGKLWFTSDRAYPVLTRGAGSSVDIVLRRAGESPAADAALRDTRWRILSLAGEPVQAAAGKGEPRIVLKSMDGRDSWSATVGCNQMSGGLAVTGDRVAFRAGMATLMACAPPLDMLEKRLGRSLLASTHWRVQGNRLELRDDAGVQTLLCEAIEESP
jgi:putative lipoprotein